MRTARAVLLALGFFGLCLVLVPIQCVVLALRLEGPDRLPVLFHRLFCRMLGVRIHVRGEIAQGGPLLLTANHSSYLDIPVMGSLAPMSFIAKRQVRDWPLFGLLAALQRSVFVDRDNRGKAAEDITQIRARLAAGETLVLFPEGTSNDGNKVLPFKSALIGAVHYRGQADPAEPVVKVQPLSVAYTRLQGLPMGRAFRPAVAWYGDMELIPHMWGVFRQGPIDVEIEFHEPVALDAFASRKALAAYAQAVVAEGVARSLSGRQPKLPRPVPAEPAPAVTTATPEPAGTA